MKTIGIIGTRKRDRFEDLNKTYKAFKSVYKPGDCIVSGGCPKGGDRFAEVIAKEMGLTITIHYPDWEKHGVFAGLIRNNKIAEDSDVLVACVSKDRMGGTEDAIKKFNDEDNLVIVGRN